MKRYILILMGVVIGNVVLGKFKVKTDANYAKYAKPFVKSYGAMITDGQATGNMKIDNGTGSDIHVDVYVVVTQREWVAYVTDDGGGDTVYDIGYGKKHKTVWSVVTAPGTGRSYKFHVVHKHPTIKFLTYPASVRAGQSITFGTLESKNISRHKDQWMRAYAVQIKDASNPTRMTIYCHTLPKTMIPSKLMKQETAHRTSPIDFKTIHSHVMREKGSGSIKGPYKNMTIDVKKSKNGYLTSPRLEKNKFFKYAIKQQPHSDGTYLIQVDRF